MGRVSDYPWQHNCPNKNDMWPCRVISSPASDHRIYVCGTEEFILSDFTTRTYHPFFDDNRDDIVSYVNSSRYESETPIQEAERKIQEAKAALAQAHENLQKAKRSTRFGVEPSGGSILKFEKRYNGLASQVYYFAAIRYGNKWYLTASGTYPKSPMTWEELTEFIGDGKCWKPRNMELLPSA